MTVSWLVTGAAGQLGRELRDVLSARDGDVVTAASRAELDLLDESGTRASVRDWLGAAEAAGARPVLVNTAAYTAVDAAEADESTAMRVNGEAPGWLAEELAGRGRLVHVSTDYVFDGTARRPYREADTPAPRTAYGRSKRRGELAVADVDGDALVVRTAWLYSAHGTNFVRTMLRLAAEGPHEVRVVDDQTGSPTWTRHLAQGLVHAALSPAQGVLHATSAGATTWCGLARRVFDLSGAAPERVTATSSAEYVRPAPRPAYSVLHGGGWASAGLPPLPPWDEALRTFLQEAGAVAQRA